MMLISMVQEESNMNFNKFLAWMWSLDAILNLVAGFMGGFDGDKVLIGCMAILLAWHNVLDSKRTSF